MIPKIIHYCWFGKKTLPKQVNDYIESWKTFCPDYKIIQWNETNFDVNMNQFVKEAYENQKWAFVSDYGRVWALEKYGGIYFDTDVEVIRGLDHFLKYEAFFGIERVNTLMTAVIGIEPNHIIMRNMIKYYESISFCNKDGTFNMKPNVHLLTQIVIEHFGDIDVNNEIVIKNENIAIYPREYFSPKDFVTGSCVKTSNTHCIHHFNATWLNWWQKLKKKIRSIVRVIIGEKNMISLLDLKRRVLKK